MEEKTVESKYDFISFYFTKWNSITKPSPRVIIDTHAGTGMVNYINRDVTREIFQKEIYGSPLLAMLKTISISNNLLIILNEKDPISFNKLKAYVEFYRKNGMPIFILDSPEILIKNIKTKRKNKLNIPKKMRTLRRKQKEKIYPTSPEYKTPSGYKTIQQHTEAEILYYNKEIEKSIDEILKKIEDFNFTKKNLMPKTLFFVDPCGKVPWNGVIKKICERASNQEGTDLIINWCWDVISRNPHAINNQLSDIYGIPLEEIEEEFKDCRKMEDFRDKYINQLKQYFKFVNIPVQVKKSLKLIPKGQVKYILLFCSNNPSANSLAGYKEQKNRQKTRKRIGDISKWTKNNM